MAHGPVGARGGGPEAAVPTARLPELVETERLQLRRWHVEDAPLLSAAVEASVDHLRPWMWWAADEPVTPRARRDVLTSMMRDWETGGDVTYAVLLGGEVIGSSGLHRRGGPEVLEIGYWIHVAHIGRGYATELAAGLTTAALTVAGVERVEIHHDRNNVRSEAIPKRLGFERVGEQDDGIRAPAEAGISCIWAVDRGDWASHSTG